MSKHLSISRSDHFSTCSRIQVTRLDKITGYVENAKWQILSVKWKKNRKLFPVVGHFFFSESCAAVSNGAIYS